MIRKSELLRLKSLWIVGFFGLTVVLCATSRLYSVAKGIALLRPNSGRVEGICFLPKPLQHILDNDRLLAFSNVVEIHINDSALDAKSIVDALACFDTNSLDVLDLSDSKVDDDAILAIVQRTPSVKYLHLGGTRITSRSFAYILMLGQLEELHIEDVGEIGQSQGIMSLQARGVRVHQECFIGTWRQHRQPVFAFLRDVTNHNTVVVDF